jgi:hypothetical protein
VELKFTALTNKERRGRQRIGKGRSLGCSPEEEQAQALEAAGAWWSPVEGQRRGGQIAREKRGQQRKREDIAWPRARAGKKFFKNRLWVHRTIYSVYPVHTGQHTRKWDLCARLPVHRTLHSSVSGAHQTVRWAQTEGNFQIFYLVLNQTKSQLIITQNNTCWDRYWYPHIFSHNFQNILP